MKKLFVLLMILAMAGCAAQTRMVASKPDMAQFQRDDFECGLQARTYYRIPASTVVLMDETTADAVNKIYKMCMEFRGYEVTSIQPVRVQPIERKER